METQFNLIGYCVSSYLSFRIYANITSLDKKKKKKGILANYLTIHLINDTCKNIYKTHRLFSVVSVSFLKGKEIWTGKSSQAGQDTFL